MKDVTCPRSHHEIGQSLDLFPGSGWRSFCCRCATHSGPQGRYNHCCSADTELCLLSPFPFSSMMCQLSVVESKSATFPSEKARHLLDDSVLESRSPRRGLALTSSSAVTNGLSLGKRLWSAHDSGCHSLVCACVCPSLCSAQWPLTLQKGLPAGVAEAREAFASGLWDITKCSGFVLILLVALSMANRWKEQPDIRL